MSLATPVVIGHEPGARVAICRTLVTEACLVSEARNIDEVLSAAGDKHADLIILSDDRLRRRKLDLRRKIRSDFNLPRSNDVARSKRLQGGVTPLRAPCASLQYLRIRPETFRAF